MKKVLSFFLLGVAINAKAHDITAATYAQAFKNHDACVILYSVNQHKIVSEYNPGNRCNERLSPDSTFKVPLSLMAFDQKLITQNTVFTWDGVKHDLPGWNQNQTPATWLKYSVVWVSQQLTIELGDKRIHHYLADFHYGNQNFSGDPGRHNGLTHAWLSSSLQISAVEQLHFLTRLFSHQLPVSDQAIDDTKQNMYQGQLANGAAYYAKTGSGRHKIHEQDAKASDLRDGWDVGLIEQGAQQYIFISNLTDKTSPAMTDKAYGSTILKPIIVQLLNDYFKP